MNFFKWFKQEPLPNNYLIKRSGYDDSVTITHINLSDKDNMPKFDNNSEIIPIKSRSLEDILKDFKNNPYYVSNDIICASGYSGKWRAIDEIEEIPNENN